MLAFTLYRGRQGSKRKKTALVLFIDEIQYIKEDQFTALIMALHKCAQLQLPILLLGAGLPQLVGQAGRAKSYAERLFEYPEIGPLHPSAARAALESPALRLEVKYEEEALLAILQQTQAYPYFLQEWGKHSWQCATRSPITCEDVAELGAGPHRSGDIVHLLKKEVQAVAIIRVTLINKGMIYSLAHGENSFTVPLFDGYMKRVMPDFAALA